MTEPLVALQAPLTAPAGVHPCALYLDHGSAEPSVTQGHHIYPVYMQKEVYGWVKEPELMHLCGTCHDNVHEWLYWLTGRRKSEPNPLPPPRARALAEKTRDWYEKARITG